MPNAIPEITNQSRLASLPLPLRGSGPLCCLALGGRHPSVWPCLGMEYTITSRAQKPEEIKYHPRMKKSSLEHRKVRNCIASEGILLQNTETKLLASTPLTIKKLNNSNFEGSEARKCSKVCKLRFSSLATSSSPRSFKKQLCTPKWVPKRQPFFLVPWTSKPSF